MMGEAIKRCAIYTRKSHEEGLEQEFNSLDAQRLSAENYINSQQFNGWRLIEKRYDDGGFSGGNTERPALKELLADIKAGKIDVVVVYKIDRLSRSLIDFAELQTTFEKYNTSFVSVTQQIDTSGSTGRMMLNILMTFAQYEREIIAERIRDKMSATRRQGKYIGGVSPFGYKAENKHLQIQPEEAKAVKQVFRRYLETQSPKLIAQELNAEKLTTRQGKEWRISHIYRMLNARIYTGDIAYKGEVFKGEHEAIISREVWNEAQELLAENCPAKGKHRDHNGTLSLLKGIIRCGHCGGAMLPNHTTFRDGRHYYYYLCSQDLKRAKYQCPVHRIPGGDIEKLVMDEVAAIFKSEQFIEMLAKESGLNRDEIAARFSGVSGLWDTLFPLERKRLLQLMVEKVSVFQGHVELDIKTSGMKLLVKELENERIQVAGKR